MSTNWEKKLYDSRGELRYQVKTALACEGVKTLAELKAKADAGEIWWQSIRRYRTVGPALVCYLFAEQSKLIEEKKQNKLNGGNKRQLIFGYHGSGI